MSEEGAEHPSDGMQPGRWTQFSAGARSSWLVQLLGKVTGGSWQAIAGLFASLFAFLLAIQLLATGIFYNRLGASLDEVGVVYTQNMYGVVVAVIVIAAFNIILVIPTVALLLYSWWHARTGARLLWDSLKSGTDWTLALALIAAFVGALGLLAYWFLFAELWSWTNLVLLGFGLFVIAEVIFETIIQRKNAAVGYQNIFKQALNISICVGALLIVVFAGAWFVFAWRESNLARTGSEISGFPSISWRAQQVTVSFIQPLLSDAAAKVQGRCALYLGQAHGVTVLFDAAEQAILRLPTSSVILRGEASPCPVKQ